MAETNKINYKDTLNLPRTGFDMRAGLLKKEPVQQERWRNEDLYGVIRRAREGAPRFNLHDGPPYANGDVHMGTALNKVLKDVVVRHATMTGRDAPYLPGWDCHGLPIEHKVMQQLGDKAASMTPLEIRRRCREYAEKYVGLHTTQFQRLGVLGEFTDPYLTMTPEYEGSTLEVFARLIEEGVVYRQLKAVHWSVDNKTALAEAELEYKDRTDPSVTVLFDVTEGDRAGLGVPDDARFTVMIWTTTPWTLPANLAVAVHPDFQYSLVEAEGKGRKLVTVVASDLRDSVLAGLAANGEGLLENPRVIGEVPGRRLLEAGLRYTRPLREASQTGVLVGADYVTLDQGTGLVHTAPGHGVDDYLTGIQEGLDIYCPVRADGTYDDTAPRDLEGLSVWKANPLIIKNLRESSHLAQEAEIFHSYPHDWRSKTPTIFRATEQWFVAVDRPRKTDGKSLREAAQQTAGSPETTQPINPAQSSPEKVADGSQPICFVPEWGRARLNGMLDSRPDWCISRQRFWGLPIPVFFNAREEPLLTAASVRAVARAFREHGSDAWYEKTPAELLAHYDASTDSELENPDAFPMSELIAGKDIFDVWFEAGSSWHAAMLERGLSPDVPVDLYLEGSDQHRGWFQLSLLTGLGDRGVSPFATVITHGFIVTEDGHKMSKSLGNAIEATEQVERVGADVLRLWLCSQDYQNDVRCSEKIIDQAADAYRKIRNTLRFLMGGCFDYDPGRDHRDPEPHSLDRWFWMELNTLIRDVRAQYDRYEYHRAVRLIYEFCTVEASSVYLSAIKDRLYCDAKDSPRRRSAQTQMHQALVALVKLLAPVIPHTAEEAWGYIPQGGAGEPDHPTLALMPEPDPRALKEAAASTDGILAQTTGSEPPAWIWARLMELRSEGLARLEEMRSEVKKPLDTEAVLQVARPSTSPAAAPVAALLETYRAEMEDLLGVGYARVMEVESLPEKAVARVVIEDARERYAACARSWKRRPDVGSDGEHPDLSARDAEAVRRAGGPS